MQDANKKSTVLEVAVRTVDPTRFDARNQKVVTDLVAFCGARVGVTTLYWYKNESIYLRWPLTEVVQKMAIPPERIRQWAASGLDQIATVVDGSRERMKLLQQELDRAERHRGHQLCAEAATRDKLQEMELQSIQQYDFKSPSVDKASSSYLQSFMGSYPLHMQLPIRKDVDEGLGTTEQQIRVSRLQKANQDLENEILSIQRQLEKQQQQFSEIEDCQSDCAPAGLLEQDSVHGSLTSTFWNALRVASDHDALVKQSNTEEQHLLRRQCSELRHQQIGKHVQVRKYSTVVYLTLFVSNSNCVRMAVLDPKPSSATGRCRPRSSASATSLTFGTTPNF